MRDQLLMAHCAQILGLREGESILGLLKSAWWFANKIMSKLSLLAKKRGQNRDKTSLLDGLGLLDSGASVVRPAGLGRNPKLLFKKTPKPLDESTPVAMDIDLEPTPDPDIQSTGALNAVESPLNDTVMTVDSPQEPLDLQGFTSIGLPPPTAPIHPSIKLSSVKKPRKRESLFTNYEIPIEITKKIVENFTNPSPDDVNINASKAAEGMKNLNVKPKTTKSKGKTVDIKAELEAANIENNHWVVVIGHVDSGKSTLIGRLLLDTKSVDLATVEKLRKESENIGKGSFALAWLTDLTEDERSRGVTTDIATVEVKSSKTRISLIDAPGHKDFVPWMINGVAQAETALVVVDSTTGEFESGFQADGQTKEHIIIAKTLGIKKIAVIVNKIDKEDWLQERQDYIYQEITSFLKDIGYDDKDIQVIPASGLSGINIIDHNGPSKSGVSIMEYLEAGGKVNIEEISSQPFSFQAHDIIDANNDFGISGRVVSGAIAVGQQVTLMPLDKPMIVDKIKYKGESRKIAYVNEVFELWFSKKALGDKNFEDIDRSCVITNDTNIKIVDEFKLKVKMFQLKRPLLKGASVVAFRNGCKFPAKVAAIEGKKKHLISNSEAIITLKTDKLALSKFEHNEKFGNIILRQNKETIGAGTVIEL